MRPAVSIIVPTYREAENLPHLLARIADALNPTELLWEVLVVDDNSPDETSQVCAELAEQHPLRLIVRRNERGLSSAVVTGMRAAQYEYLLCMDADLSHPPEAIPAMLEHLIRSEADFVIGSRYVDGGTTDDDWGLFRWLNSIIATGLARPLTRAKDPMAGFFALRQADFEEAYERLDPIGYKIGLELLVKCDCQQVREVPIHFADRQFGESKLSLKEQLNYLRHLRKLYRYRWPELSRFLRFGAVGGSGVFVNLGVLSLLLAVSSLPTPWAMALAIWVAMSWNFALNRRLTFADQAGHQVGREYLRFCLASLSGAGINWFVAIGLWRNLTFFSNHPVSAQLIGIAVGMLLNFALCRRFVFLGKSESENSENLPEQTSQSSHSAAA